MSWQTATLGKLCDDHGGFIQTGPFGSQLKQSEYVDDPDGVPVVMPKDIKDGRIDLESAARITEQKAQTLARHFLADGDIIFPRRGDINKLAIVEDATSVFCGTGCLRIHTPSEGVIPKYLYYFLGQKRVAEWLEGRAIGSTMLNLNTSIMRAVEVEYPAYEAQKRIAAILSAYDDLIENNRRRIVLLEEAARQLYKEWFVRLRFPGHDHTKIANGVPEEWEHITYGEAFSFLGGFAFQSSTYVDDGKYGVVTIKNVHDGRFVPECGSRVMEIPSRMNEYCNLSSGDVLLSLTGNVGRTCIVYGNNYLLNQRVAKIEAKRNLPKSFVYWTFSNPDTQRELENLAYGVAQLNLSPVKLAGRPFVLPPLTLLSSFDQFVSPVFDQIIQLNLANVELAKARDFLLPRLMNGSLTV